MNLFFTDRIQGNTAILPEEEARHCVQVMRKKAGDEIFLVDGQGGFYRGQILAAGKRECLVRIEEKQEGQGKRDFRLHIGIAPTKNIDRLEWFLEKATEIGIDEITPLRCEHSERKNIREDRLEKVILAAMKQSLKAYLPTLHPLTPFHDFVRQQSAVDQQLFIGYVNESVKQQLGKNYQKGKNVCILIGPEGDFSEAEVALAQQQGFTCITLGNSRLRTETAGIVACHTINFLNEVDHNK